MSSESLVGLRRASNSNIYKYYPSRGNSIFCVVCSYRYRKNAPLSTLQKHLRVKHGFSIRNPPTPMAMRQAIFDSKKELGLLDIHTDCNTLKNDSTALLNTITTSRISINNLLNTDSTSLEEAIADWVHNEGIPLSSISSPGFRQIIQICNSSLVVPSESRFRTLALKRTAPNHTQFLEPQFKPLPQHTISSSKESFLGDSSNPHNDHSYEVLFDSPHYFESYRAL